MTADVCDVYIDGGDFGGWYLLESDKCDGCRCQVGMLSPRDNGRPLLGVSHQCLEIPDREPSR